jgi:hypothetical protein
VSIIQAGSTPSNRSLRQPTALRTKCYPVIAVDVLRRDGIQKFKPNSWSQRLPISQRLLEELFLVLKTLRRRQSNSQHELFAEVLEPYVIVKRKPSAKTTVGAFVKVGMARFPISLRYLETPFIRKDREPLPTPRKPSVCDTRLEESPLFQVTQVIDQ